MIEKHWREKLKPYWHHISTILIWYRLNRTRKTRLLFHWITAWTKKALRSSAVWNSNRCLQLLVTCTSDVIADVIIIVIFNHVIYWYRQSYRLDDVHPHTCCNIESFWGMFLSLRFNVCMTFRCCIIDSSFNCRLFSPNPLSFRSHRCFICFNGPKVERNSTVILSGPQNIRSDATGTLAGFMHPRVDL